MDRMCLNNTKVCDGTHDCKIQPDVVNATFLSFLPLPHSDEFPAFCEKFECPSGSTKCRNGYQCLLNEKWHDGSIDCQESDDDEEVDCGSGYFKCSDNKCIPGSWMCDGDKDCSLGEDEQTCTACNGTAFYCGAESNKCLPRKDVCDGYEDCLNGSDEHDDCGADYNEHHGRFPNHRHISVNITSAMDYDERGASMFCDNSKEFHCRNSWRDFGDGVTCVPYSKVCDSLIDCPFTDDELSYPRSYENKNATIPHEGDACTDSCSDTNVAEMRRQGKWNCDGECVATPTGPVCTCGTGLYWDNAVFKCHDVNECELHNRCQQQCVNYIGGFACECVEGYVKEGAGICRANKETTVIFLFDDHLEWQTLDTSNISTLTAKPAEHSLQMDIVNTVISMTSDPGRKDIFILDKDGLIARCPMSYPDEGLEKYDQFKLTNAQKIEYDPIGHQIYAHDGKSIFTISQSGKYVTHVAHLVLNDFTLVSQIGMVVYVTDTEMKAINMDGTNDILLFNSTRVKFSNVKVDYPSRRIFYVASGMPEGTLRVLSAKFDGSDKFRHYTLSENSVSRPMIHLFENKLFLTDGSRQSLVYHGDKFPTRDSIYDKMIIMKLAINIEISNIVLTNSPLLLPSPPSPGVFRFGRNKALTAGELISDINNDNVRMELVYRCSSASPQMYKTEPDCKNIDCPMPVIAADNEAISSMSRSGKILKVTCNDGYHVSDVKMTSTSVTCSNGAWSGSFQCVRIQCPQLPRFQFHEDTNVFDYSDIMTPVPGDTAFITCIRGTFYQTLSNITLYVKYLSFRSSKKRSKFGYMAQIF